jgi:transposase
VFGQNYFINAFLYAFVVQKRFIQLTSEETITLQEGMKNGIAHLFRKRCHCLILSSEGYEVKDLAQVLGVSPVTIYGWLNRWEEKGVVGLRDLPGRGRKPILTLADFAQVKERVQENAQQLRLARVRIKEELERDFSEKTLRRYIKI